MEENARDLSEPAGEQQPETSPRRHWMRRYVSVAAMLVCAYLVYVFFFSSHSVMRRLEYQRVIDSLNLELSATRDSVAYYQNLNQQLTSDPVAVEQVVRERHNMNRPDEDVYLMKPE